MAQPASMTPDPNAAEPDRYITRRELERRLSISRSTVRRRFRAFAVGSGNFLRFDYPAILASLGAAPPPRDGQGPLTRTSPSHATARRPRDPAPAPTARAGSVKNLSEPEPLLTPGDYRCAGCGWVGTVARPIPLRQLGPCPQCQRQGQVQPA